MKKKSYTSDWPVGEDGQKVRGVQLIYAKNPIELDVTQSLLDAYGIPSFANAPNQGFFSGVIFGSPLLGATLYVPETCLEEARALLDAQVEEDPETQVP